jgi:hypothetical protein
MAWSDSQSWTILDLETLLKSEADAHGLTSAT